MTSICACCPNPSRKQRRLVLREGTLCCSQQQRCSAAGAGVAHLGSPTSRRQPTTLSRRGSQSCVRRGGRLGAAGACYRRPCFRYLKLSPRSVFPWDKTLTQRVCMNVMFHDRRKGGGTIHLVTSNEHAPDVRGTKRRRLRRYEPQSIENQLLEVRYINANYRQQVVNHVRVTRMPNWSSDFNGTTADAVPSPASVCREWVLQSLSHVRVVQLSCSQVDAATWFVRINVKVTTQPSWQFTRLCGSTKWFQHPRPSPGMGHQAHHL
jgi:hypothetical protein